MILDEECLVRRIVSYLEIDTKDTMREHKVERIDSIKTVCLSADRLRLRPVPLFLGGALKVDPTI